MNLRFRVSSFLRQKIGISKAGFVRSIVHGYVDEVTERNVAGWMRNPYEPETRLAYEVAVALPGAERIIATGIADRFYPALDHAGIGDAHYGFHSAFPEKLTAQERRHLLVRPRLTRTPIARAPAIEGYVDALSSFHVAGWIRNRFDDEERVVFEVVLAAPEAPEQVLARGTADQLNLPLAQQSIGDGRYGFRISFDRALTEAERAAVTVRPLGGAALPLSPYLVTAFEPIDHIAIDIVNNCNLRCPFCLYDYADTKTTKMMSPATFEALLPLLPYVRDGNFWLSCLHEPTLNPDFLAFIERVPAGWRRKIMFTTNLAKRMPAAYFEALAGSGISHINISLESLDPEIFERMRKGARWPIFKENWDRLIAAWRAAPAPPRLRYIVMAYRSNRDEIPGLVEYLRAHCLPWQIEVRHTYNGQHIAADFRRAEFLRAPDWAWLAARFSQYPLDEVMLIPPTEPADEPAEEAPQPRDRPAPAAQAETPPAAAQAGPEPGDTGARRLTQPFNIQVDWDGKFVVYGKWNNPPELKKFAVTNINELPDPFTFLMRL